MTDAAASDGRGVLDTSAVVLLRRITEPSALPPRPAITSITLAELPVAPAGRRHRP